MAVIKQDDLIQSVADALQFISYYHPVDFIQAMHEAYLREESPAARDSMAQILINSRMCATGHRPICQDTGIVTVFVRVGLVGVRGIADPAQLGEQPAERQAGVVPAYLQALVGQVEAGLADAGQLLQVMLDQLRRLAPPVGGECPAPPCRYRQCPARWCVLP